MALSLFFFLGRSLLPKFTERDPRPGNGATAQPRPLPGLPDGGGNRVRGKNDGLFSGGRSGVFEVLGEC